MKLLVTGGSGFIGTNLCTHLVQDWGDQVLNLDALTYAGRRESHRHLQDQPNYRFIHANICDRAAVTEALAAFQPDAILHLAAESHVDRSINGAALFVETNIVGTFSLLEAVRQYFHQLPSRRQENFRFIHVSTDEVFGSLGAEGAFSETSRYDPSSPYAASKAASDHLVRAWGRTYGLPIIVTNCSNNYGPYQFPEKLIPLVLLNALEGKRLPVYGRGDNRRDWLFVGDHVAALRLVVERGVIGDTYGIGGYFDSETMLGEANAIDSGDRSNLEVVQAICDLVDAIVPAFAPHRNLIEFVADRPGHDHRYAIDARKCRLELGWQPRQSFASGLAATVEWYLSNRDWWQPLRQSVYGGERLGLVPNSQELAGAVAGLESIVNAKGGRE